MKVMKVASYFHLWKCIAKFTRNKHSLTLNLFIESIIMLLGAHDIDSIYIYFFKIT